MYLQKAVNLLASFMMDTRRVTEDIGTETAMASK
jgi:hypothetical protein